MFGAEGLLALFDLKEYARRGAQARLVELNQEIEAIYGAFPDLRDRRRGPRAALQTNASSPREGVRKRRTLTAAQRKAVGERMRKYWAARRAKTGRKSR